MKRIMVVDDDKDLLANMKAVLRRQGYDVAVTTSCDQGFQIVQSFQPDLIFLDINVGDEDGREMCRKIRGQAEYMHIAVILISADHEALQLFREYEANAFLHKPFHLAGIVSVLNEHL